MCGVVTMQSAYIEIPVAPGGRHVALRNLNGLLQSFEGQTDHIGGRRLSSGRIDSQADGIDQGVRSDLIYGSAELSGSQAEIHGAEAFRVDYRDAGWNAPPLTAKVGWTSALDQPPEAAPQLLDDRRRIFLPSPSRFFPDPGIDIVDQGLPLPAVRLRHPRAGQVFEQRLVGGDAQLLETDPQSRQALGVVRTTRGISRDINAAQGIQDDAVGGRGQLVGARVGAVHENGRPFAGPRELSDFLPDFPEYGRRARTPCSVDHQSGRGAAETDFLERAQKRTQRRASWMQARRLARQGSVQTKHPVDDTLAQQVVHEGPSAGLQAESNREWDAVAAEEQADVRVHAAESEPQAGGHAGRPG